MLAPHGLDANDIELVNVNFSLSPSLISGQVDAVIGAFRNFELNQMDIVGSPGRAFYPEEEGVPAYDELIFVANTESLDRPELRRFVIAVETGDPLADQSPGRGLGDFSRAPRPELDDELNARAWRDTLPRLALSPAALDTGRYARFAEFLVKQGLIDKALPVGDYAVDLFIE